MTRNKSILGKNLSKEIDGFLLEKGGDLRAVREHLHMYPERSWEEKQTTEYIITKLVEVGLKPQLLPKGGVIFDIGDPASDNVVAIRADLDALPIEEISDAPYRSRIPGKAHACGHDVHTTIVLGTGLFLARLAEQGKLNGRVRLIFQPAEEVIEGAQYVVANGGIEGVRALLGMHCYPALPAGAIGLCPGVVNAGCYGVKIVAGGLDGHSSKPQETSNMGAVLSDILALPGKLAYQADPRYPLSLVFCNIHAGSGANNVVPPFAHVDGTLRYIDQRTADEGIIRMRKILKSFEASYGVKATLTLDQGLPPLFNDKAYTEMLYRLAQKFGFNPEIVDMSFGGDDFTFYPLLKKVYALVGTGLNVGLHKANFDIIWQVVPIYVKFFTLACLATLEEEGSKAVVGSR